MNFERRLSLQLVAACGTQAKTQMPWVHSAMIVQAYVEAKKQHISAFRGCRSVNASLLVAKIVCVVDALIS